MRLPDRTGPAHLSRYWAALIQEVPGEELAKLASRLDPTMLTTIARMRSVRAEPRPDPDFVHQLEAKLMNAYAQSLGKLVDHPEIAKRNRRISRPSSFSLGIPSISHRWAVIAIGATLLTLLALVASFRLTDPDNPGRHAGAPSIIAQSTPDSSADVDRVLFEITLPADVIPTSKIGYMFLGRYTIPANSQSTKSDQQKTCCPGAKVYLIVDGTVTLISNGLIQLVRSGSDGELENVETGNQVELGPGDVVAVRNEDSQTWITSTVQVDIITATLTAGYNVGPLNPAEWLTLDSITGPDLPILSQGTYLLRLHQIELESDNTFPMENLGIFQIGLAADAFVGSASDGTISVTGVSKLTTVFLLSLSSVASGAGTPVAGIDSPASPTP